MVFKNLAKKVAPTLRSVHTTSALKGHHNTRGVYGSNVPFPVDSKVKIIVIFSIFFGSGIAMPFLSLRHKILAANPPE